MGPRRDLCGQCQQQPQLRVHLAAFVDADNFAMRLKAPRAHTLRIFCKC